MDLDAGGTQLSDRPHRPQHCGTATHVVFHHFDLGPGHLEVVSTGIEGETLTHQGDPPARPCGGPIDEVDEFGGQV